MTRAARGRDDASIATGIDAPRERGPEGGIVRFGMGAGAARTGGASHPRQDIPPTYAAYAQARYVPPATSQPVQPEKKGKRRAAF